MTVVPDPDSALLIGAMTASVAMVLSLTLPGTAQAGLLTGILLGIGVSLMVYWFWFDPSMTVGYSTGDGLSYPIEDNRGGPW